MSQQTFALKKAHCSSCGATTNHSLIAERDQRGSEQYDEHYHVSWSATYKMLECCGCETVHLSRIYWCSEWERGDVEIRRFPPAVSRRAPAWHSELKSDVRSLFEEVYAALHADSRRLAVMGARALLDIFMTQEVGDVGSFAEKLKQLEAKGIVSTRSHELLDAALEAGHAAAHRGHNPKPEEVKHVIDIVENLFAGSLLGSAAESLRKATPPR